MNKDNKEMSKIENISVSKTNKIQLIEDYEKIAAGEVIERPVSVVKELVENAIDADSTRITINLKKAGKELIEIIDNGLGIPENDVQFAFQRHTTSKIRKSDDLDILSTLGFRGEALASISAISLVEIRTRHHSQDFAVKLVMEAGKKIEFEKSGAPQGTHIQVKNLFFNLPVREKFLKSDKVELGHISDLIGRYSLAYPFIHFKLTHNGLTLINSPAFIPPKEGEKEENIDIISLNAFKHSIQTIYDKKTVENMFPIDYYGEKIHLYGFIGNPQISRSRKSASSLFVNKRLVTHKGLMNLINTAYKDYLMRNKHPFYVLFIDIPPEKVDCNIHPSKKIVKFLDEENFLVETELILKSLIKAHFTQKNYELSKESAQKNELSQKQTTSIPMDIWAEKTPKLTKNNNNVDNIGLISNKHKSSQSCEISPPRSSKKISIIKEYQKKIPMEQKPPYRDKSVVQTRFKLKNNGNKTFKSTNYSDKESLLQNNVIRTTQLPFLCKLDGGIQAGKTYLLFQNEQEIVIIDQHAAHERINYEKVQKMFNESKLPIQELISPIKLEVPKTEVEFVKDSLDKIQQFGFKLDFFGGNIFLVRTIPTFLKERHNSQQLIIDTCIEIINKGKAETFNEIKEEILQYMACHMSIVAGNEIHNEKKIRKIINELDSTENPEHCAHGRPTYIKISYKDLDKWFHRT